jgi:hypothetical protein
MAYTSLQMELPTQDDPVDGLKEDEMDQQLRGGDEDEIYNTDSIIDQQKQIMSQDEEDAWIGKYFSSRKMACESTAAGNKMRLEVGRNVSPCIEEHMAELEKEFEESMKIASFSAPSSNFENCMHKVYAELHNQVETEMVDKLKMAMQGVPECTKGLADCRLYFSTKQHYTLQDVLVAQYVLNDGLLMRQNQGLPDEHHVDISDTLE